MARARNIKPGFFRNADLVELPVEARLLFIGLWTIADREGRLKDRPKQIKMDIFPADNFDCNALVQMIADAGMLVRYEHGGNRYLQITNFSKHQNPHKDEQASTIPAQGEEPMSTPVSKPQPPVVEVTPPVVTPVQEEKTACTIHAPCMHHASTEVARLNPESLIPESLIPEEEKSSSYPQAPHQAEILLLVEKNNFVDTDPKHPRLRGLLERGATVQDFAHAVPIAKAAGKGFAYLLGVVEGKMSDEIARQSRPKTRDSPGIPSVHDPESRASIEDLGIAQGLGRWNELTEHWSAYKARVLGRSEPPPPVASNIANLVQTAFKRRA
jgi:hypothetical protein